MHYLQLLGSPVNRIKQLNLSRNQQWLVTAGGVTIAGAPFTPLCHELEHTLVELLPTNPALAGSIMLGQFGVSLLVMRFLFTKVLNSNRFHKGSQEVK